MLQKVAIVKADQWGFMRQERRDYDDFVKMLEESLKEVKRSDGQLAIQVRVVQNTEEAWIGGTDVIVYVTRGMFPEAKKVAAENPDIRIVLFTGSLPEGEVVLVKKGCASMAYIEDVILV